MSNYFDQILIDSSYKPKAGSFGKPRQLKDDGRYLVNSWFNCRELWHPQLYSLDIFFFSHKLGNGKNIAGFFDKLEDLLKIKNRTKFGPTQRKTIMYIKPSRWWTRSPMRRSLFTIFLRCASFYSVKEDNFYLAIFCDEYALKTKSAIDWFLLGNTVYKGKKIGWLSQFNNIKIEEIEKLLVKESK